MLVRIVALSIITEKTSNTNTNALFVTGYAYNDGKTPILNRDTEPKEEAAAGMGMIF